MTVFLAICNLTIFLAIARCENNINSQIYNEVDQFPTTRMSRPPPRNLRQPHLDLQRANQRLGLGEMRYATTADTVRRTSRPQFGGATNRVNVPGVRVTVRPTTIVPTARQLYPTQSQAQPPSVPPRPRQTTRTQVVPPAGTARQPVYIAPRQQMTAGTARQPAFRATSRQHIPAGTARQPVSHLGLLPPALPPPKTTYVPLVVNHYRVNQPQKRPFSVPINLLTTGSPRSQLPGVVKLEAPSQPLPAPNVEAQPSIAPAKPIEALPNVPLAPTSIPPPVAEGPRPITEFPPPVTEAPPPATQIAPKDPSEDAANSQKPSVDSAPPVRLDAPVLPDIDLEDYGTIVDFVGFDVQRDVNEIRLALVGTHGERMIFDILCSRSFEQRMLISLLYEEKFGKAMCQDLLQQFKGTNNKLLAALLLPRLQYLALQCMEALKGLIIDSDLLTEVICPLSNEEICELRDHYTIMFDRCLLKDIFELTSGLFRRIMVALINGKRPILAANPVKTQMDAKALQSAVGLLSIDDDTFVRVYCGSSWDQLRATLAEYERLIGRHAEEVADAKLSTDAKKAIISIINVLKDSVGFFASRIYKALRKLKVNEKTLIRIVITRSEIDLLLIREVYPKMYRKRLEDAISGSTSGAFRDVMIRVITGNRV